MPTDISVGNVHVNQLLTGFSIAYRPRNLIADMILPVVNVSKQTDLYTIVNKEDWLRVPDTSRSPGEKPKRVTFSVSSDSYFARNYALGADCDYETQANADNPITPMRRKMELVRDGLGLDFEVRVRDKVIAGVGSSSALSGGDAWSDYANSDPITNVRVARQAIHKTTGYMPNLAIIGQKAWEVTKYHPDIVNAVFNGGGGGGTVSLQQFASFLDVDKVLVGRTVYNSAAKGQTGSYTDVWSTHLIMAYVDPNPSLDTATFGLSFNWSGPKIGQGSPGGFTVMTKEDEEAGVTNIWTGYYQDEKITAPELGFLIKTGIS